MLGIFDQPQRLCDGLTRREWLKIGGAGAIGLSLPQLLAQRASAAARPNTDGRAKSVIVLFFLGGPPQHETWDPKPDAPSDIRGDLQTIRSKVSGFDVGELMPLTAAHTDKICTLRAVSTRDNAHSTSGYAMSTGVPHIPLGVEFAAPGKPNDWPCVPAVVKALRGSRRGLPGSIVLPEINANDGNKTWPGQDAGWLGRDADPWLLECDPSAAQFEVPSLALPRDISPLRFDERRSLLSQFDQHLAKVENSKSLEGQNAWHEQAFNLLRSSDSRAAFDLSQELSATRERYGRTKFGQSVLLARRLVEAGVSLVQVNWSRLADTPNKGSWDTHEKNTASLRKLMPVMDAAYSALLEDLSQRGLLDETLVVWMGEFGRTPKISGNGGRDHWGPVFSIAMAGGGVRGGQVHGASDRLGAEPKEGILSAADVTATIFHALGYQPTTPVYDMLRRPIPISQGRAATAIF